RKCDRRYPPGRKAYQRGAHTIWEVNGGIDKLYCSFIHLLTSNDATEYRSEHASCTVKTCPCSV
ncbi:hypothetical protein EDC04DRAFT_2828555, partial [Pisolithus marmoratus]